MDFRNYGVKIMGGYQFEHLAEQENMLNSNLGRDGFLSPGHNSAYYDLATKKYYLIHHTRFVFRGEEHQVRVRELFINEDGWLIASPFRYDAGTIRTFNTRQLSGQWKIINHGRDNNTTAHPSQLYTFNGNGTITGSGNGTLTTENCCPADSLEFHGGGTGTSWELKSDGKTAHIRLDGKLYKGVFLRCYDEYHAVWVYAFTAMSEDGIALWGATLGVPQA
jgi:arabinan endo-1,5-alpha-L-arabinosidase